MARFYRDGYRVHQSNEFTCPALAKECASSVLRLQGRLSCFQANDLLTFHHGHGLRVEQRVDVGDYFNDLRREFRGQVNQLLGCR